MASQYYGKLFFLQYFFQFSGTNKGHQKSCRFCSIGSDCQGSLNCSPLTYKSTIWCAMTLHQWTCNDLSDFIPWLITTTPSKKNKKFCPHFISAVPILFCAWLVLMHSSVVTSWPQGFKPLVVMQSYSVSVCQHSSVSELMVVFSMYHWRSLQCLAMHLYPDTVSQQPLQSLVLFKRNWVFATQMKNVHTKNCIKWTVFWHSVHF